MSDHHAEFQYDNGQIFRRVNRSSSPKGMACGWMDTSGYLRVSSGGVKQYVHRIVWEMHHGAIPCGMVIDHINQDKTDNRIENLRIADKSLNGLNRSKARSDSTTGLIGVLSGASSSGRKTYQARLTVQGSVVYCKNYPTAQQAHSAYINAKRNSANV